MSISIATKRNNVNSLEELLYKTLPVLDHGFVRVIDYMGDDSAIVQAARISYGKGTKAKREDEALINYLMRHYHTTPFEMCEIKLHIKLPFFVMRQLIRHRTANVNEYSGRYSILSSDYYIPEIDKINPQSATSRQGRSDDGFPLHVAEKVQQLLKEHSQASFDLYTELLNLHPEADTSYDAMERPQSQHNSGISRELARTVLSLNFYTEAYWKIDLHNLLNFLFLRSSNDAQYEIRVYAQQILELVKIWVPLTYNAFIKYRKQRLSLSHNAWAYICQNLKDVDPLKTPANFSAGEWKELLGLIAQAKSEEE